MWNSLFEVALEGLYILILLSISQEHALALMVLAIVSAALVHPGLTRCLKDHQQSYKYLLPSFHMPQVKIQQVPSSDSSFILFMREEQM